MTVSMSGANKNGVRIGVPYRTLAEEQAGAEKGKKLDYYYRAIREAGGEPIAVSLALEAAALGRLAESLDGFVLTGSPADVDPAHYGAPRHKQTAPADPARERTDRAMLDHALAAGKPVLAICYGNQLLNVYCGGSLIQDIASELPQHLKHEKNDGETRDPEHAVSLEAGTRLAALAGATEARVNSSHHQAIREAGRNLRVIARAGDGIIEAVQWTGEGNWILGVQWHPERMEGDAFASALFRELVAAACHTTVKP